MAREYPGSLCGGYRYRKIFDKVETYFMFIGYSRSGHSLIGSLLDAHPDILCGHELGVLKYVRAGFSREQIYYLLMKNSTEFTDAGRISSGYSYKIRNQWQGRFNELKAIGDNHAAGAVLRFREKPWLLDRLQNMTAGRVKFIHTVRNPYDNISTMARRERMTLSQAIDYYFGLCDTVCTLKGRIDQHDLFEFRHEDFIVDTKSILQKICRFLGSNGSRQYLEDCARIVYKSPNRSRDQIHWENRQIVRVKRGIDSIPFLSKYSHDQ